VSDTGGSGRAPGDDDASVVLSALTRTGAKGLSVGITAIHRTIEVICLAAAATGAVALLLGIWAWRNSLPGSVIAAVGGGITVAVAILVLVRIRALATAVKHPGEVLSQAQDLVVRAKGSPQLHKLAGQLRSRKAAKAAGLGRMRRALSTGRLVSSVIGLASPDPVRHRYLVPFTPERLKNLWLAILVGLWAWLVSAVIASMALLSLALQTL
jgi:hypothetical protein